MRGVGIGLRRELHAALLKTERRVDWLEVVPENFMDVGGRPRWVLDQCRERWPLVTHGVSLSLGNRTPDPTYLDALGAVIDRVDPPYFSDHACWTSLDGVESMDLLPLPWSPIAAERLAAHARVACERIGRPLVLENITTYAVMPGSTMTEGAFLRAALEEASAFLLLDVNNVYVNAVNHGRDPLELLMELPLERVRQIHLAGHRREGDLLLDTHDGPVSEPVLALYRAALERTGPVPVLIEWDQRIPALDVVLDEADRARAILASVWPDKRASIEHDAA